MTVWHLGVSMRRRIWVGAGLEVCAGAFSSNVFPRFSLPSSFLIMTDADADVLDFLFDSELDSLGFLDDFLGEDMLKEVEAFASPDDGAVTPFSVVPPLSAVTPSTADTTTVAPVLDETRYMNTYLPAPSPRVCDPAKHTERKSFVEHVTFPLRPSKITKRTSNRKSKDDDESEPIEQIANRLGVPLLLFCDGKMRSTRANRCSTKSHTACRCHNCFHATVVDLWRAWQTPHG